MPPNIPLPLIANWPNSTFAELSVVISPALIDIPLPPVKCARVSAALGPVYVNTPVVLLYANDPSPPASVADTARLASESALAVVKYKLVEPSDRSSVVDNAKSESKDAFLYNAFGIVLIAPVDAL